MKALKFIILLLSISGFSIAQSETDETQIQFGHSFTPDYTFTGSGLKGSHIVGQAEWRAQDGELIGRAKPGAAGGWLFLDSAYQDVGFHSLFSLTEENESGVLFRIQKTADGMSGVLLSIKKGEVAPFQVTLDAQGKVLTREKLRSAGGSIIASPLLKIKMILREGGEAIFPHVPALM